MVVDEEMEEEVPAGASPGVHDAGTPDPRRDSIASEPSSSRRDSIASVPSTSRRPAEPCARCGFDVGQHRAIVGAARLACACWLCLQCLGRWQAAAMHTGTVPVCPTCGDTVAACEGYYALGPSGPVAGEWVPFDGFGKRLLSSWHQKYMLATHDKRESCVAVTLSRLSESGAVTHVGGIYSTAEGVPEPAARKRRDFLEIVHVLGRVAHRFGEGSNVQLDGLDAALDSALSDTSLLRQSFTCFMAGSVRFAASGAHNYGFLVPPVKNDVLASHRLQRELYGTWAACEISRKILNVYRTGGMQGLVTAVLQNPAEDRALGALLKLGLAVSFATVNAAQVPLEQCVSACVLRACAAARSVCLCRCAACMCRRECPYSRCCCISHSGDGWLSVTSAGSSTGVFQASLKERTPTSCATTSASVRSGDLFNTSSSFLAISRGRRLKSTSCWTL
jgi:hypothetical protein